MGGQAAPDTATRARSGRPASGRRSRGCPDAGHVGRRPVRVLCPPCGCPSNRSSGRPVSTRCPRDRCPRDRCHRGVRTGVWCPRRCSRAVRTALASGMARCGGPSPLGQWVRRAAVVRGRRGRPPAWGLGGNGWCWVGRGWLARGRLTWAAASRAHRLRRRLASWRQGSWSSAKVLVGLAGEHENEQVLTVPSQLGPG
jgi:hypothetical protein